MEKQMAVNFDNDPIGASILEAITSGLYSDNLNCIREYVQNALDARARNIHITTRNGRDLEILDDGHGMDQSKLTDSLRVGYSEKKEGDIGWRGIGIWSGAAVCERINISTQTNDGDKLFVSIDCSLLTTTERPLQDKTSAAEILRRSLSKIDTDSNDGTGSFTRITLSGIYDSLKEMFSKENISKFLERTVPMQFSKDFTPGKDILARLSKEGVEPPRASIFAWGKELSKRPADPSQILLEPVFVEICHGGKKLAIAWFVGTNRNKRLSNGEITFRKSNFRVGDTSLVYKNTSHSYRGWQCGEIHILDKNIIENASRDGFNASVTETNQLYDEVGKVLYGLEQLSQYTSGKLHTKALENISKAKTDGERIWLAKNELTYPKKITHVVPDYLEPLKEQVDNRSADHLESLEKIAKKDPYFQAIREEPGGGPRPSRAFETLNWKGLDANDRAENALISILSELSAISKSKNYGKYPMATGMLIRSAYERSMKLLIEINRKKLENPRMKLSELEKNFENWCNSGRIVVKGGYKDSNLKKSFDSVKNNNYRELLNGVTHNADIVRLTGDAIDTLASGGMCAFLQDVIEEVKNMKDLRG